MKTVVITGSTRGIGYALGKAFLKQGCNVVFSSRHQDAVDTVIQCVVKDFTPDQVAGFVCDVCEYEAVNRLWDESIKRFGNIDIWINNAGISNSLAPAWEIPVDEMKAVVSTNILGELYGTKVAMQGFLDQGFGALYNLEGMGADGKTHNVKGLSVYGLTKAAIGFFNRYIAMENQNPNIITGALQPGMVLTDLVTSQYEGKPDEWEKTKGILTIIANPIDEVVPWIVKKILNNKKNGVRFAYPSTFRIMKRMLHSIFKKEKAS